MRCGNRGNASGTILILVGLIVAILTLLSAALLARQSLECQIMQQQEQKVVLQYLAEAGVEALRAELVQNSAIINRENDPQMKDWEQTLYLPTVYGEAEINTYLRGPNHAGYPEIVATARLPGGLKKSILAEVKPPLDYALFVENCLTLNWREIDEDTPCPGQFSVQGKVIMPALSSNYPEKMAVPEACPRLAFPQFDFETLKGLAHTAGLNFPGERDWAFFAGPAMVSLEQADFLTHPLIFVDGDAQIKGPMASGGVVVATGKIVVEVGPTHDGLTETWPFTDCYWLAREGIYFTLEIPLHFQGLLYTPAHLDFTFNLQETPEEVKLNGMLVAQEMQFNAATGQITLKAGPQVMAGLPPEVSFLNYGVTLASYVEIFTP